MNIKVQNYIIILIVSIFTYWVFFNLVEKLMRTSRSRGGAESSAGWRAELKLLGGNN